MSAANFLTPVADFLGQANPLILRDGCIPATVACIEQFTIEVICLTTDMPHPGCNSPAFRGYPLVEHAEGYDFRDGKVIDSQLEGPPHIDTPRELTSHKVTGLNDAIVIGVLDEPGSGGATHVYQVALDRGPYAGLRVLDTLCTIRFQNGPIKEAGLNGLSNEALLAIVADRLEGFQSGPFASDDNEIARNLVRCAMQTLHRRTKERMARNVEGTHQL